MTLRNAFIATRSDYFYGAYRLTVTGMLISVGYLAIVNRSNRPVRMRLNER